MHQTTETKFLITHCTLASCSSNCSNSSSSSILVVVFNSFHNRKLVENKAAKYLSVHCTPVYRLQQPSSTISQPASADCTALSEDYIWPSGFLCGRPDGLELTTDRVS